MDQSLFFKKKDAVKSNSDSVNLRWLANFSNALFALLYLAPKNSLGCKKFKESQAPKLNLNMLLFFKEGLKCMISYICKEFLTPAISSLSGLKYDLFFECL